MSRPKRLPAYSYCGPAQYFLTFCVNSRRQSFIDVNLAQMAIDHFLRIAVAEGFAILAYCLMPDHVHLLVEGIREDSDLRRFARKSKQASGFAFARESGERLWQEGYYERVLRSGDDARTIARYIVANPVRAGLVQSAIEYRWSGSQRWSLEELVEGCRV